MASCPALHPVLPLVGLSVIEERGGARKVCSSRPPLAGTAERAAAAACWASRKHELLSALRAREIATFTESSRQAYLTSLSPSHLSYCAMDWFTYVQPTICPHNGHSSILEVQLFTATRGIALFTMRNAIAIGQ